jgi:Flp pilus assembly protein TadG
MKPQPQDRSRRRGAVTPLMAVLIIPLLAMMAFAIDLGWIDVTQSDLQNAADAAALAGAEQLISDSNNLNGYVQYSLAGQMQQSSILSTAETNARQAAKNYASYNSAGGVSSLVLNDSDIEFGFTDAQGNYTAAPPYSGFPNTVKVTLRRDGQANGPLGLFFAPVIGTTSVNLQAKAAATPYVGVVDSFQSNPSKPIRILPMTYDVNHWNNFLATGQGPDGTIDTAANGAPQLQVYPSIKFTGNFGELSLDQGNDGASTISGWIANGVSGSDLANEFSAGLLPLSKHDHTKWDWKGNPGLKTSTIHTTASYVGYSYLLPLFKPLNPDPNNYAAGTGNGSHYFYNIVQFVGITITYVDNKSIHVQPSAALDPNVLMDPSTVVPAGTSSPLITTYTTPKLTQ